MSCTAPFRLLRGLLGALGLLSATSLHAQQQDEQLWLQINTNIPVTDDVRVTLEQIGRFSDTQEGLYQTEFGALFGVRVADGVELGFGYRRVGFHSANLNADEDRLRQQVVATFGAVSTRLRVDERFHPGGREIGFRIRPLIRYNHRVGSRGAALFVSHESSFLPNSTRWGQRRGYERMRNIVGVALPLGSRMVADIGYLNQYRFARGSARPQMEHALNLQLTINLRPSSAQQVND